MIDKIKALIVADIEQHNVVIMNGGSMFAAMYESEYSKDTILEMIINYMTNMELLRYMERVG